MKKFPFLILSMGLILLLTACLGGNQKNTDGKITVTPYELSEKEKILIEKAGAQAATFFELNGKLAEGEDLQYSVEVYHNGEFQEVIGKTWGAPETAYNNTLISFAAMDVHSEDHPMKLISGFQSGNATFNYELDITASSFGNLIGSEITLEKYRPTYLASLTASKDGAIRSIGSLNGEFPENIEDVEYALLYTILWTDLED